MRVRLQSGCIPFRIRNDSIEILIVKKKNPDAWWGFTKGGQELHLTPEQNAAKECYEEAGITGKVLDYLGISEYMKGDVKNIVRMYAMEYFTSFDSYPEKNSRDRMWLPIGDAYLKLAEDQYPFLERLFELYKGRLV